MNCQQLFSWMNITFFKKETKQAPNLVSKHRHTPSPKVFVHAWELVISEVETLPVSGCCSALEGKNTQEIHKWTVFLNIFPFQT